MGDLAYLDDNPYTRGGAGFEMTPEQRRALLFSTIANTLVGLGTGISQTAGSGQPWFAGVAPGAATGLSMNAADRQFQQTEAYRRAKEEVLRATPAWPAALPTSKSKRASAWRR